MSTTSSMRVLLPVLLGALLGVERVHSLYCYSCEDQKSNWHCLWPVKCSSTDSYCYTLSASAGLGNLNFGYTLNKGCAPICPTKKVDFGYGVLTVDSRCCEYSFCNFSTASRGLHASVTLLGLGLLLSLVALLQLGP
ncbi:lymphocyte antigen 6E [Nannospalax galili]|uniref:Lymphocyte antigen 6 family member E n=1 Tax=Nannospalax galili TaxID=1026970 RepID=A0A8C6RBI4_NANGA|nr:lymphocyte antigen 6E [Nannospalax galili]XP_017656569.1 lymphocyte antigen 6E [Nannospalax galili]